MKVTCNYCCGAGGGNKTMVFGPMDRDILTSWETCPKCKGAKVIEVADPPRVMEAEDIGLRQILVPHHQESVL